MLGTNNKLLENISSEFNIENDEAENIIQKLFSKITSSILDKNRFYIYKVGILSLDQNNNITLNTEDENFDESLESLNVTNNNIKNIFLEKSIYKSICKNIADILKEEDIYIKNFGTFSKNNFEADSYLKNKIKELDNNEITEDILDELDSQIKNKKINYQDEKEEIEEIVEVTDEENKEEENKSIDNNVVGNIWKNYNSIDLNSMIKNLNEKEDKKNDSEETVVEKKEEKEEKDNISDNKNNGYPEMKEYSKEELLDINHFDKEDLESNISVNNEEDKKETENILLESNIQKELLNNKETLNTNIKKSGKNTMDKNNVKRKNVLLVGIIRVIIIIIVIFIIGIASSIYYNSNKIISSNRIENRKLYDIVNEYFNEIDSANLSYVTSKDMYYWDIAKTLYGDATYWPLIYAYNNDKFKISNVIRKGSTISYRNIPDFYSIREIRYLNNTLSKSYIYVYPILTNDNKYNHALWALKLSAYYDLNVFKNNSNIIPEETYTEILNNNNTITTTYNELIKYGQLNENMVLSLFDIIKETLGIKK
ncbi:LysM peptidoglycan-binding domain-containing protein [Brachyspira hyodysenteriae]|uniref:LysM peptidoglycan-binding domain-containing protein n=1 Tax=Brachyspira hyodysenteriae TaxID=159 RepID=UPI00063DCF0F|nr:hypothetical protein [Brachyspira hyodysenteriae]KLI21555.1 hypothetical protein SU43_09860 [Brachyspira hyodysenteriae]KLI30560.1 hypothetical protein SZ50_12195 [Brachyspira hyodysenteriae]TVL38541.1 hypothetical protein A9X84_06145 [Brachyspira hyodysenteriae]TVL57361.1 hypothetical protein A9X83_10240 [Brachyspira hyodysenteriae]TVL61551.1 hypothetical protein A9X86_08070 [Brachyspira hyodysenteriae]